MNRGEISRLALARTDLQRTALSAETQLNWMTRVMGSMMLRPGLGYIGATASNNAAKFLPFIFSSTDTALIELTSSLMRVWVSDALVTRLSVSTAVANGTFGTNLTSWTDADEAGAASAWYTGGFMELFGTGFNAAIRRQQVTVSAPDQNVEHALRIIIARGSVVTRVGSASGTDDYISETTLAVGAHSLAFTPTGASFWIEFQNRLTSQSLVDSVAVEAAGVMTLPTPWTASDLSLVRWDQSADVVFVACAGYQQRRIERRATRSWSIVNYAPVDGPFRTVNTSHIRLTPSAVSGACTITASAPFFKTTHVGALFKLISTGQYVNSALAGSDQFTSEIRITGVGASRKFYISTAGVWVGQLTLQRSVEETGSWTDFTFYTTNQTSLAITDGLDNQIIYYRIGFKAGQYTSGSASCSLAYSGGTGVGVVRVYAFASSTSVGAIVVDQLGGTTATETWYEGAWSDYRGWPSAVALHEGRLWWAGKSKVWGSISDAYESFDADFEGDAGPISRSIGSGPVDRVNWMLSLQRLILGTDGAEVSARSSSFDEPLTPTNFNLKDASTQGSARISPVKIDGRGVYVQSSGQAVNQLVYNTDTYDYESVDLTVLNPDIGSPGIVAVAVQKKPDKRIHCVRSDGKVAVLVFDPAENVVCWVRVDTTGASGLVEDVVVLPGTVEDSVYYCVKRTVNGSTVRYLEKWAQESTAIGGAVTKLADSHVVVSQASSVTVGGLTHLVAATVVAWVNGVCPVDANGDIKTYTVSGAGTITLDAATTSAVVGLPYDATYKSTKLAYFAGLGTAVNQRKRVGHVGFVLADTHAKGIKFGPDFTTMDDRPGIEQGTTVGADAIDTAYDEDGIEFPGGWSPDARVCLKASAPRPCTVLGLVISLETNDHI